MGSRYIVIFVVMAVVLYLAAITSQDTPPEITPTLPDLSFTLANGEATQLSQVKNKLVLIHFWASWCPPCLPELPEMVALAAAHPDDLLILAYSLDKTAEAMQLYYQNNFEELPANFIPLWDEGGKIARQEFYSFSYPETYIIGCDGKLTDKAIGAAQDWPRKVAPYLKQCAKP